MPSIPRNNNLPWIFKKRKREQANRKFYNSKRWKKLRQLILNRDKGLCQDCLKEGITHEGNEVDHITPIQKGGSKTDPNNLQTLCRTHHQKKTNSERLK